MKAFIVLVALGILTGCGTPWLNRADQQAKAGQCNAARDTVRSGGGSPDMQAAALASIAADCDRDMPQAYRLLNLSARYGNPWAQQQLAKEGQPVPPADLRQAPPDYVGAFLRGYYAAPRSPMVMPPVNCRSVRSGNVVNTDCY
jgi:hypothetical protein